MAVALESEDAPTTDRTSIGNRRIEVITGRERRRRWTADQKREIAAESLQPGVSPVMVARRHGISSGLLYTWRQRLLCGALGAVADTKPRFVRVDVVAGPPQLEAATPAAPELAPPATPLVSPPAGPDGRIEIMLSGGAKVRVDAQVNEACIAAGVGRAGAVMIAAPPGVRVYLACGTTDMRRGMVGLAMQVQQVLSQNPFDGAVFAFRGRGAGLIKLLWHDGIGLCLLTKRLERGHFIWPMTSTGTISLTASQLATLLEGCEWRAPVMSRRPELVG